jgi:hypothetical protein
VARPTWTVEIGSCNILVEVTIKSGNTSIYMSISSPAISFNHRDTQHYAYFNVETNALVLGKEAVARDECRVRNSHSSEICASGAFTARLEVQTTLIACELS